MYLTANVTNIKAEDVMTMPMRRGTTMDVGVTVLTKPLEFKTAI